MSSHRSGRRNDREEREDRHRDRADRHRERREKRKQESAVALSRQIAEQVNMSFQTNLPVMIAQIQSVLSQNQNRTDVPLVESPQPGVNFVLGEGSRDKGKGGVGIEQPHPEGRRGCDYKTFTHGKPSTFEGEGGPIAALTWLEDMETCFITCQCTPEQKVRYASTMLKGDAQHWWNSVKLGRGIEEATDMPWFDLRKLVKDRYCPTAKLKILEEEFLKLEQGTMTVDEYVRIFTQKSRFAEQFVSTPSAKVDRFMSGMKRDLRRIIQVVRPQTFEEAVNLAIDAEKDAFVPSFNRDAGKRKFEPERFENRNSGGSSQMSQFKKTRFAEQRNRGTTVVTGNCHICGRKHAGICRSGEKTCYKCGQPGHLANSCGKVARNCYLCGATDHVQANCPKGRVAEALRIGAGPSSGQG